MITSLPLAALLGGIVGLSISGIIILSLCIKEHMSIIEAIKSAYGFRW